MRFIVKSFSNDNSLRDYSNRQLVEKLLIDWVLYINKKDDLLWSMLSRKLYHKNNTFANNKYGWLPVTSSVLNALSWDDIMQARGCLDNNVDLVEKLLISEHVAAILLLQRFQTYGWCWLASVITNMLNTNPLLVMKLLQNESIQNLCAENSKKNLDKLLEETKKKALKFLEKWLEDESES